MCTCIDTIKASYSEVQNQTSQAAVRSFDVNDYLDAVNDVRKELEELTTKINRLVELVRDHFTELSVEESRDLLDISKDLRKNMTVLYNKLRQSSLYSGMKTAVSLYHDSMTVFGELCHDLKSFNINLKQDGDFQQTLNTISALLHKVDIYDSLKEIE